MRRELEAEYDAYQGRVAGIVLRYYYLVIVPTCERQGLTFAVTEDGWTFFGHSGRRLAWNSRKIPNYVRDILDMHTPGLDRAVGWFMPDYPDK